MFLYILINFITFIKFYLCKFIKIDIYMKKVENSIMSFNVQKLIKILKIFLIYTSYNSFI